MYPHLDADSQSFMCVCAQNLNTNFLENNIIICCVNKNKRSKGFWVLVKGINNPKGYKIYYDNSSKLNSKIQQHVSPKAPM